MKRFERAAIILLGTAVAAAAMVTTTVDVAVAEEEEAKKGPPFGERKKPPPPKPPTRTWTLEQKGDRNFLIDFDMKPGIPDPGQLTEVMISLNEVPAKPHPRFGNRVPQQDARVVVELNGATGELLGRYVAHAIPLSRGKYGLHITPAAEGIHTMVLRATTADDYRLNGEVKLPVAVWPLPEALQGAGAAKKTGRRRPIKL